MKKNNSTEPTKITLTHGVKIGNELVNDFEIRKPKAGELRGLKIFELVSMDVEALMVLLPRITSPAITRAQIYELDPSDILKFGSTVSNFFIDGDIPAA